MLPIDFKTFSYDKQYVYRDKSYFLDISVMANDSIIMSNDSNRK